MKNIRRNIMFSAAVLVLLETAGCRCGRENEPTQSCPFLFLFNGEEYIYHTDLAGSVLGAGIDLFDPEYYDGGIYALGNFVPDDDGLYRMKVRETIYEADYFDKAQLILVDVPPGYQVLNEWSFTSQLERLSPKDFMTIRAPRAPLAAVNQHGADVLPQVSEIDEVPLPVQRHEISTVIVDFGSIDHPEHAKLILTAWSHYADLEGVQRPPFSAGTTIETLDENGVWVVRMVAGKNPGDRRTWVVDIAHVVTHDDTRMRITMAHQPIGIDILDRVLLDDSVPVPLTITRVDPTVADLHYGGTTNYSWQTLTSRIHSDDGHNPPIREAMMAGAYTRYGDVRPLLAEADDRFVIMAHADELTLAFQAPPQPTGVDRHAFLDADVFYSIKHSVKGLISESVYPLPFHGMTSYPYDENEWPYRDDPDYQSYLDTWNTRHLP